MFFFGYALSLANEENINVVKVEESASPILEQVVQNLHELQADFQNSEIDFSYGTNINFYLGLIKSALIVANITIFAFLIYSIREYDRQMKERKRLMARLGSENSNEEEKQVRNICLITAHPDDECMFFTPTLMALLQRESAADVEAKVFVLCLSKGLPLFLPPSPAPCAR